MGKVSKEPENVEKCGDELQTKAKQGCRHSFVKPQDKLPQSLVPSFVLDPRGGLQGWMTPSLGAL